MRRGPRSDLPRVRLQVHEGERVRPAERRRFFRVDDEVLLRWQRLPMAELPALIRQARQPDGDGFGLCALLARQGRDMNRSLPAASGGNRALERYLRHLDDRINCLGQRFLLDELLRQGYAWLQVNLSAGGLIFPAPEQYAQGELLAMRLVLLPEMAGVLLAGQVVYCEHFGGSRTGDPWQTAVEYVHILESDRDLICAHVMRLQTRPDRDS